ncbi:hypothetical protein GFO_3105 [Christiangramia forsetii KT0803]|uniref:Uncharacterized protein n=2 Tax=Christiangramia forsetii TaxID=411153 RepID=A0M604_CHRFK|nr:hypothetical protein GFO_3105 [Christiangramia forsetii KT0803]
MQFIFVFIMHKRPRIQKPIIKDSIFEKVDDNEAFKPNCASENARLLYKYNEFEVELWIDKHYHSRRIHGDDYGKREGIEEQEVQELIVFSFKYLVDIFLRFPKFKFINFFENGKIPTKDRVILKQTKEDGTLNVVVEIHFLETSKYEVTVVTAMQVDDFNVGDGQYVLSITEENAILRRSVNKDLRELYRIKL